MQWPPRSPRLSTEGPRLQSCSTSPRARSRPTKSRRSTASRKVDFSAYEREPHMTRRRVDIVVTTIFEPRFLDGYVQNLETHGHDEAGIIVIIDRKTPS